MDVYSYDPASVLSLLLTIMRVSIVMFMLPVFSTNNIPVQVKAAITLVFTLGIWPHLALPGNQMPAHPFDIVIMILGEAVMGLVLLVVRSPLPSLVSPMVKVTLVVCWGTIFQLSSTMSVGVPEPTYADVLSLSLPRLVAPLLKVSFFSLFTFQPCSK